jgi:Sarcoglycan complex subunit protein
VQLEGQAIIMDELRTSHIRSRHGTPITFGMSRESVELSSPHVGFVLSESSRNITWNSRDSDGQLENQMFLGHDRFEVSTKSFRVADPHGNTIFSADRDSVEIASNSLRIEGQGGVTFKDSIQTNLLKAEPGKDLK